MPSLRGRCSSTSAPLGATENGVAMPAQGFPFAGPRFGLRPGGGLGLGGGFGFDGRAGFDAVTLRDGILVSDHSIGFLCATLVQSMVGGQMCRDPRGDHFLATTQHGNLFGRIVVVQR